MPGAFADPAPSTPQQNSFMDPFFIPSPKEIAEPDLAAHQLSVELETSSNVPIAAGGESHMNQSHTSHQLARYLQTSIQI